jgi:uncharacterized membrane protein YhaH (DUF805 family)
MDFSTAIKTCFSKYVTFSGRASRSEFWWFMLFVWLGAIILSFVDSFLFGHTVTTTTGSSFSFSTSTSTPYLSGLFWLVTILPGISVTVRRLHDTGRSGWWYWLWLIPLIGFIVLIVFFVQKSDGPNKYGTGPDTAATFA